jgi:hypothetical protein
MAQIIQFRRDGSDEWIAHNPILAEGEIGIELENYNVKIGNGISSWNELPYGMGTAASLLALQGYGTYSQQSGTIQFVNSNSFTFGLSNDGVMTASFSESTHDHSYWVDLTGNTLGTTTLAGNTMTLSGGNYITLGGASDGRIRIDGEPGISVGVMDSGNTGGSTGAVQRGVFLVGSDNITLSQSTATGGAATVTIFGGGGNNNWTTATKTGSDIQISTGVTNTLHYGKFITTGGAGGGDWSMSTITGSGISVETGAATNTLKYGKFITTAVASEQTSNFAGTGTSVLTIGGTDIAITLNTTGLTLGYPKAITTAMVSNGGSNFLGLGTTTNSTAGSDLIFTVTSAGINLGIPKWLTTAALSANTSNYAGTGTSVLTIAGTDMAVTLNTTGLTLGYPKYITTGALSANTSNYAGTGTSVLTIAGSDMAVTLNTTGLTLGYPKYLTIAAASDHSHGGAIVSSLAGTVPAFASASNGLSLGMPAYITTAALSANTSTQAGTGFSSSSQTGSILSVTHNTSNPGLSMLVPAWITTAALSANTSNYAGIGTSLTTTAGTDFLYTLNTNGLSIKIPKFITTGGVGGGDWAVATTGGTDMAITTGAATNTLYYPKYITTYSPGAGADWSCSTTDGSGITVVTGAATHTLSYGNFLTTAMQSACTSVLVPLANSTQWGSANLSNTFMNTSVSGSFQQTSDNIKFASKWSLEGAQTAGTVSQVLSNNIIYFSGGNMMTLSGNASTIIMSVNTASLVGTGALASLQYTSANTKWASKWSLAGANTAGTNTQNISDQLYFSGGNNITLSGNASTIIISAASALGPASVVFSDAGGITWSSSSNGSTTTIYVGSMSGGGGGGAWSVSSVAGTDIAITTGAATNTLYQPKFITTALGTATAASNVTWTANSSGISLNAIGYAGTNTAITGNASITLNSSILSFNGSGLAGTATTITTTSGDALKITLNSAGMNVSHPKFVTTYAGTVTGATNCAITVNTSGVSVYGTVGSGTSVTNCAVTLNTAGIAVNVSVTGSIYFGDIAGYSFTSSTAASRTTFYIKTAV